MAEVATADGFPGPLTDQERRVAEAVGRGATNKAVARQLSISTKTVEYHLGNVYRKLGVQGRVELAHLVGAYHAGALVGGEVVELVTTLAEPGQDGAGTPAPRNPYKGLRPFAEDDAADFFGRGRLVERVVEALAGDAGRFVTLVGPSGSGKTSLVRAGVLPAVRGGDLPGAERCSVATVVPGERAVEALRQTTTGRTGEPVNLVVLDQLEELYTVCGEAVRDELVEALVEAATAPGGPRVVATLRADFFDRPLSDGRLAPMLEAGLVTVTPMDAGELEAAIVGPARRADVRLEPGLAAVLVGDVRDQPGALPLLQFALAELFDQSEAGVLTFDAYRAIGGVGGAVSRRAEQLYTDATPAEQDTTRRLFTRLVALGDDREATRRRVVAAELPDTTDMAAVLSRYGAARLLTFDRDPGSGVPTVELAHEAVIGEWPRLRDWLDDDRAGLRLHRELTARSTAWAQAGRDASELYRGARLEATEQWASAHAGDLNTTEAQFLAAAMAQRQAEVEAERRNRRRVKRGLALVAVVAVVALIAGAIAWHQQRQAASAAERADRERDAARAAELAAETSRIATLAPTLARANPALALLLAAEAERRRPGPESWGALQQSLVAAETWLGFLPSYEPLRAVAYDGPDRIVGVGDRTVTTWDARTRGIVDRIAFPEPIRPPAHPDDFQQPVAVAGGKIAWVDGGGRAHLFDLHTGDHAALAEAEVDNVALDPGGERLALVTAAGDTAMYRVEDRQRLWSVPGPGPRSIKAAGEDAGLTQLPPVLDAYPVRAEVIFGPGASTVVVARGWSVTARDAESGAVRGSATFPALVSGMAIETAPAHRLLALGAHALAAAELPTLDNVTATGLGNQLVVNEITPAGLPDGRVAAITTNGQLLIAPAASLEQPAPPPALLLSSNAASAVETVPSYLASATDAGLSPDGSTLVVAGPTGASLIAADGGGLVRRTVARPPDHVRLVGGHDAAWVGSDAPLMTQSPEELRQLRSAGRLWSCGAAKCNEQLDVRLDPTTELNADPASDTLGVFTNLSLDSGTWQFYNGSTMQPLSPPITPELRIGGWGGIAHDRSWVAIANLDTSLQVFDVATGRQLSRFTFAELGLEAPGMALLPANDEILAFSHATGDSYVLDVRTGARRASPLPDAVTTAQFGRTGAVVVTVGLAGDVSIRDGTTFEGLHQLPPADQLMAMALSDDDRFLLTVHPGGGRLWDVASGQQVGQLIPTQQSTEAAALPGEQLHLLTAADQWVQIWDLDVDGWGELACRAAGRNLTRQEWQEVGPRDEPYRATCPQWPEG